MPCYVQIRTRMKFLSYVGIVLVCLNILTLVSLFFKDGDQSSSIEWKFTGLFFNFLMFFFGANASTANAFLDGAPDRMKMRIRSLVLLLWIVMTYWELLWLQIMIEEGGLISESFSNQRFLQRKVK